MEDIVDEILSNTRTVAVVGLSDKPGRSSYGVAQAIEDSFEIIPVNPNIDNWRGKPSYKSLEDIPAGIKIDLVNVFRRSEFVPELVEQVIQRGVPYLWLQQGVIHEEAKQRAEEAGVKVVMDACLAVALRLKTRSAQ